MHLDEIRALPKVPLHDHLDGGLRPETVIDLAQACGYDRLRRWTLWNSASGSSRRPTVDPWSATWRPSSTRSACQTEDALRRVAAECVEDLAADGVVYAEVRLPRVVHSGGLTMGRRWRRSWTASTPRTTSWSTRCCARCGSRIAGTRSPIWWWPSARTACGYGHRRSGDRLPRPLFAEPFCTTTCTDVPLHHPCR